VWPDVEADVDLLNFSEVAEIAASMVRDPAMRPPSLGVFGGWGAGKSTILQLIESAIDTSDESGFIVVKFDAWLF
jgi:predicted KAP-like P-loop ATPase